MARVTTAPALLLWVLMLVALKASRVAEAGAVPDEDFFPENSEEASGMEVDPTERPTILEERSTSAGVVTTEGTTKRAPEKSSREHDPPTEAPDIIEEDTLVAETEGPGLATEPEEVLARTEHETEIPHIFGDGPTDFFGGPDEGSGIEETTIPPAFTELITETDKDAEAQLKTTTEPSEPPSTAPEEPTKSEEGTSEPTEAPDRSGEMTAAQTTESIIATAQPAVTTEPSIVQPPTSATPTSGGAGRQTAPITISDASGGVGSNQSDPCSRTFCRHGDMCEPAEDGQSATCRCPHECAQSGTSCCSVYMEEYRSVCEMHKHACGLGFNIALRNMGSCADSPSKSAYLPKMVSEGAARVSSKCPGPELIQFASRFQEWAMLNKEQAEAQDPSQLDLNSAIKQARTGGLSRFEKRQILKFQFTAMDRDSDWQLDRREVEAFLRFVPSEHCLFGFMVSADVDRNGILNRDEWYGAFDLFQGSDLGINFGKKL